MPAQPRSRPPAKRTTRKRTTAAQRKAAADAATAAEASPQGIEDQGVEDVLMVGVVRNEDGSTGVVMQVQGDIRPTEIPEILRMAQVIIERNRKLEN